jgi:hypothetical protein
MSKHAKHARLYTFRKLIAFKMTQYTNVFWLDTDTEVRANLTEYFLSLPRDRDAVIRKTVRTGCGVGVFNSGVMVVRLPVCGASPLPHLPPASPGLTSSKDTARRVRAGT